MFEQSDWPTRILVMLSQQDQEMRRNVPDPSFAGGSHLCGSGAGNETSLASQTSEREDDQSLRNVYRSTLT